MYLVNLVVRTLTTVTNTHKHTNVAEKYITKISGREIQENKVIIHHFFFTFFILSRSQPKNKRRWLNNVAAETV